MAAPKGHPRYPGAGRVKGTPNKKTVETRRLAEKSLAMVATAKILPLDVMMCRVEERPLPNGKMPTDEQFAAAVAAAPYVHPRLAAMTVATNQRQRVLPPIDVAALPAHLRAPFEEILLYAEVRRAEAPAEPANNGTGYVALPLTINAERVQDAETMETTDGPSNDDPSN